MTAYYNEFDPFAVQWLRELIKEGVIADGIVDDRSILEVDAKDLEGFNQHHFFAGIGGWSYALRLAGWSDNRYVCTASLPCQPFSVAGQNLGKDDERHLLPHFMQLVRDYGKFDTIMGEQVEGAVRHGWLDDLQANMEAEGYSTGAIVLGAHSVNAPHQRQRLYWVADSTSCRRQFKPSAESTRIFSAENEQGAEVRFGNCYPSVCDDRVADSNGLRQQGVSREREEGVAEHSEIMWRYTGRNAPWNSCTLAYTERNQEYKEQQRPAQTEGEREADDTRRCSMAHQELRKSSFSWNNTKFVYCRDGKYRPIPSQPEIFPLVNGISTNRVGILRGAGNAIVPQVAAEVIRAFMEEQ